MALLTIIDIVSFVGIVYCVVLFLIAFLIAVRCCPKCDFDLTAKDKEKQSLNVKSAKEYSDEMLKKYGNRG